MAARGYASVQDVAAELGGVTLTPEESTLAEQRIEAVELLLDKELNRTWLILSPILDESGLLYGGTVYLRQFPVESVDAVRVRSPWPGSPAQLLAAGTSGYELLDPRLGLLVINYPAPGSTWYSVDYTALAPVPMDVQLFTAKAAAHLMGSVRIGSGLGTLHELGGALNSITIDGDLTMSFRGAGDSATGGGSGNIPSDLWRLVEHYRRVVIA